jgi:hypothetical protein
MYVFTEVLLRRANVYALPQQALIVSGNQTYCYLLQSGKALKTPVVAGLKDKDWVAVDQMKTDGRWGKVTAGEQVIAGNLDELTDGQAVQVAR